LQPPDTFSGLAVLNVFGGSKRANSAPQFLAGFEGPLGGGERKGKGKEGGEKDGRKGTEGMGENTP